MMEDWTRTAANLIYHFRALVDDKVPFNEPWTWTSDDRSELLRLANLSGDGEASRYLSDLKEMVEGHCKSPSHSPPHTHTFTLLPAATALRH
jgi:hypothetical protein